jgi:hypothetical protein
MLREAGRQEARMATCSAVRAFAILCGAAAWTACGGSSDGYAPGDGTDTDADGDADADADAGSDTDSEVVYPKPCADIYDQDIVPTFEFDIEPDEWAALQQDCFDYVEQYRPIVFRYGDESQEAMVRLKGYWSWICEKLQFVVSFNEVDPDARFHGLRKIVLDAPWYDPTLLHERMAMDVLARTGAPYSCVNNARLLINGEYYGVYANVERIDHEYLERHFEAHDGNLYKTGTELKTNEETADTSDRDAFWAATDLEALDAIVDLDQAVATWAGEAMLPDPDSYWAGVEINFYIYNHPGRGFLFLPYDADISFAENIWPDAEYADPITYQHPEWLREAQYQVALSDPSWCEAFVDGVSAARAAYDVPAMQGRLDAWSAQIADAVAEDPHKTFSTGEHDAAVAAMRAFFQARADFVDEWLAAGGHCPPAWPE